MLALFIPVGILLTASLIILSAISLHFFTFQIIWIVLGIGLVAASFFVDVRTIFSSQWVIWGLYAIALALMALALAASPLVRNTHSWLVLGPFSLQPVELMKVALILLFANYFVLPAAISVKLPDLGSAVIFFGIWFGFLLLLGLPWRRVIVAVVIILLAGALIWTYVLKPYHRARIVGFLDPNQNALGINYSAIQSRIAIGSAGLWGQGYGQGTQAQLGFLSEPSEDFIFAAFIEEWGIVGGIVIVAAFLFLIFQILRIGMLADENFEKFICLGTAMMLGVQFLLNTGSATGLTPVIGVTFPFVSYGGSSMLANFFTLSMVNSIRRRS